VVERSPEVRFTLIGEGDLKSYLLKKAKKCLVEDNLLLSGYRFDVFRLLGAGDLLVFPTHLEGLLFLVVEAMARGPAIIASTVSSLPETLSNEEERLLFQSRNPAALPEVLRFALRHPENMNQMARKARLRALEFSGDRTVKITEQEAKYPGNQTG
jgi:glycosyltransferase involved in cell wall biosynthesis